MHFIKANWMERTLRGLAVTTLLVSGIAATCSAQVIFQYNFSGSFLTDPNAAAEQQAVIDAGNLFSAEFGKYFSNSGTIVLNVDGFNDPNSNVLANAGSNATLNALPGLANEVILQKLQTGVDFNGAAADGDVNVNFAYPYGLDPNAPLTNGQFDFFAILDHEFTHAFGFGNFIDVNGLGLSGLPQYAVWDTFLTDKNGNKILNPDFTVNQAAFDSAKLGTQNGGGFFFGGANALASNGGALVTLYSPGAFNGSVAHLDDTVFPTDLMKPARDPFPTLETRLYSGVDVGILTDLGYTPFASTVPEPGSLALLVGMSLSGAGFLARRRKKAHKAA